MPVGILEFLMIVAEWQGGGKFMTLVPGRKLEISSLSSHPGGVQLKTGPNEDHSPQGTGKTMRGCIYSFLETPKFSAELSCD